MSGHSKWANIKHKKGKTDALKAKLATKIGREITVAARMGGADPTGNMRLKLGALGFFRLEEIIVKFGGDVYPFFVVLLFSVICCFLG